MTYSSDFRKKYILLFECPLLIFWNKMVFFSEIEHIIGPEIVNLNDEYFSYSAKSFKYLPPLILSPQNFHSYCKINVWSYVEETKTDPQGCSCEFQIDNPHPPPPPYTAENYFSTQKEMKIMSSRNKTVMNNC